MRNSILRSISALILIAASPLLHGVAQQPLQGRAKQMAWIAAGIVVNQAWAVIADLPKDYLKICAKSLVEAVKESCESSLNALVCPEKSYVCRNAGILCRNPGIFVCLKDKFS